MSYQSLLEVLLPLVERAGESILNLYDGGYTVKKKPDQSLVTEADLRADQIIRDELKVFGYPILSEESEDDLMRLAADRVWIVDSLDGTRGFVEKTDEFSVMVGLAEKGRPVLGVVYLPIQKRLYHAISGRGAFVLSGGASPRSLQVSSVGALQQARVLVSRFHMRSEVRQLVDALGAQTVLPCGSIGVKMARIAEGEADLYFNPTDQMGQWDLCAPQIIVEEAGGRVTGLRGETLVFNDRSSKNPYGVMVSNGRLHEKVISLLSSFPAL